MKSTTGPVFKIGELWQVCMVVNDLDKAIKSLWSTFGIGPWNVYLRDPDSTSDGECIRDMTYHGKPARFGYTMASTPVRLDGIKMEVIQPGEGDTIYRDFIREHGEGVQHLGWHVVDTPEAFARTKQTLESSGFPCIMSGRLYNSVFGYFDTTSVLKTVLEVVWRNPEVERPAPFRVFPE